MRASASLVFRRNIPLAASGQLIVLVCGKTIMPRQTEPPSHASAISPAIVLITYFIKLMTAAHAYFILPFR